MHVDAGSSLQQPPIRHPPAQHLHFTKQLRHSSTLSANAFSIAAVHMIAAKVEPHARRWQTPSWEKKTESKQCSSDSRPGPPIPSIAPDPTASASIEPHAFSYDTTRYQPPQWDQKIDERSDAKMDPHTPAAISLEIGIRVD
ncbi:hypothetical protein PaG_04973 [Moesziomyces aphidis]|uniref:Uncharacterized protein n=1 Tax=Moesziomyces aphidis TaxID=84754 RepID=W3VHM2_MOEAP|nr:hypothetical protein PaG_04973 [Moesziomyces aphidis]